MEGDSAQAGVCYIRGTENKGTGKMVNIIYQIEDKLPYKIKDVKAFGELNPRNEEHTKKVNTSNEPTLVILNDS